MICPVFVAREVSGPVGLLSWGREWTGHAFTRGFVGSAGSSTRAGTARKQVRIHHIPIRDGAGFRNRRPACVRRKGGGNATGWLGSPKRRDVAGRAPAHREYQRNETQCR